MLAHEGNAPPDPPDVPARSHQVVAQQMCLNPCFMICWHYAGRLAVVHL